jgi:hypothetical protein
MRGLRTRNKGIVGDGSLQSHSGANLHPKTVKDRVDVPKGGKADGVSLTVCATSTPTRSAGTPPQDCESDLSVCISLSTLSSTES